MLADEHDGVFTVREAVKAGISRQNLVMLARRGKLSQLSRGLYRLVNYPADQEQMQLWEAVLWPELQRAQKARGVISHLIALHLHSSALGYLLAIVDVTIPSHLRIRRERPRWLRLHVAELPERDVTVVRGLPVTTLERSLIDCIASGVESRLLRSVIDAAEKDEILSPQTITTLRAELAL